MFTIHNSDEGFATGSKDGTVILWDADFKPITKVDLVNSPVGYQGRNGTVGQYLQTRLH